MDNQLLGDLLFGPAQPLPGSALDDDTLLRLACEEFPDKEFCIVRRWMVIDVIPSDDEERKIQSDGLKPTVIYAQVMITKTGTKRGDAHGVLSGFQLSYHACFFETKDMLYILAGRGSRRFASKPTVSALARHCSVIDRDKYEDRSATSVA